VPQVIPPGPVPASPWIIYDRPAGCCGPVGGHGPIGFELYFRSGFYFPLNNDLMGQILDSGWAIGGGARTLFFNLEQTKAWTIDFNIQNHYSAANTERQILIPNYPGVEVDIFGQQTNNPATTNLDVTIRDVSQTMVGVSLGREWYLTGCADRCRDHVNWRMGLDGGGRYGYLKIVYDQVTKQNPDVITKLDRFKHDSDVVGGMFVALHSDVEIPCGCCLFFAGVRGEWGYHWSDILKVPNHSDIMYINLLGNLGIRF
jgi:hypothetical protein